MKETSFQPTSPTRRQVEIRPAQPSDRAFVQALAVKVFSIYGSYGRYLTDWLDTEGVMTFIGELEGRQAGVMMLIAYPDPLNPAEAVADMLAIAVEPEFQSHGVGTMLLRRAIAEAPALPCRLPIREIHLSVAEGNARAQRLFAKHGFRLTQDEGIYPAGQRALHMVRAL